MFFFISNTCEKKIKLLEETHLKQARNRFKKQNAGIAGFLSYHGSNKFFKEKIF